MVNPACYESGLFTESLLYPNLVARVLLPTGGGLLPYALPYQYTVANY